MLINYKNKSFRDLMIELAGRHRTYLQDEADKVEGMIFDTLGMTLFYRQSNGILKSDKVYDPSSDLFDISVFSNLKFIKLGNTFLKRYLHKISNQLESIELDGAKGYELKELSRFPKLKRITLGYCDANMMQNIPKEVCEQIEYLNVDRIETVKDLKDFLNLKELHVGYILEGTDFVLKLPKLEKITTKDFGHLFWDGAEQFPELRYMDIKRSDIVDLEKIKSLKQLEYLNLSDCGIYDITPLEQMDLKALQISDCMVEDISPIKGNKNLEYLVLDTNPVTDISCIEELQKLQVLHIHDTWVEDVSAVEKLQNLKELAIDKRLITKEEQFNYIKHVPRIVKI